MYFSIRHRTTFRYSEPVSESVMEVRTQPRTEGPQRCLSFDLVTVPRAVVAAYTDHLRNRVHHFDIPDPHTHLSITAQAVVELTPPDPLPDALGSEAWEDLDALTARDEYWDTLMPSHFAHPTELLRELAIELRVERGDDPLTLVRRLTSAMYDHFAYVPQSTRVDSPIDEALRARRGVCQDFAHIMIALLRGLGLPARYVSGYLAHDAAIHDRSQAAATHAWVEVMLPGLGWIGADPTNNLMAGERHIRVAVGRDYADVPPTRGVFKGTAQTELAVAVRVVPTDAPTLELAAASDSAYRVIQQPEQQIAPMNQEQPQQ